LYGIVPLSRALGLLENGRASSSTVEHGWSHPSAGIAIDASVVHEEGTSYITGPLDVVSTRLADTGAAHDALRYTYA
jgi:hypothetical protein